MKSKTKIAVEQRKKLLIHLMNILLNISEIHLFQRLYK